MEAMEETLIFKIDRALVQRGGKYVCGSLRHIAWNNNVFPRAKLARQVRCAAPLVSHVSPTAGNSDRKVSVSRHTAGYARYPMYIF
jgi:hypothetical protein